jgi:hypothetical protein
MQALILGAQWADLINGWCVAQQAAELARHEIGCGVGVIFSGNMSGERVEVATEVCGCELGGQVVAKLGKT